MKKYTYILILILGCIFSINNRMYACDPPLDIEIDLGQCSNLISYYEESTGRYWLFDGYDSENDSELRAYVEGNSPTSASSWVWIPGRNLYHTGYDASCATYSYEHGVYSYAFNTHDYPGLYTGRVTATNSYNMYDTSYYYYAVLRGYAQCQEEYIGYGEGTNILYGIGPTNLSYASAYLCIVNDQDEYVYKCEIHDYSNTIAWNGKGNQGSYNNKFLQPGRYWVGIELFPVAGLHYSYYPDNSSPNIKVVRVDINTDIDMDGVITPGSTSADELGEESPGGYMAVGQQKRLDPNEFFGVDEGYIKVAITAGNEIADLSDNVYYWNPYESDYTVIYLGQSFQYYYPYIKADTASSSLGDIEVTMTYYAPEDTGLTNPIQSDIVQFTAIGVDIIEMDFQNSVNNAGASEDNNFDIVDDSGDLLVSGRGPEWTSTTVDIPTVYIKDRKVRADVVLKITPVIPYVPLNLEIYSEGDLDFTPSGTDDKNAELTFDLDGYTNHIFTTYTDKVLNEMNLKEYTITWKGFASGNEVKQWIYTLYDTPTDNYNNSPSPPYVKDIVYRHLMYLLGPSDGLQEGDRGNWCEEKYTLNKNDATSIQIAVREGIQLNGKFKDGAGLPDPWDVVTTVEGGPCETYADLMKEALLVAGVPIGKIDRKSVVSDSIPVSTWLGESVEKKILKVFKEPQSTGGMWINEGVCGVDVADNDFWYYKVVGLDVIGRGGWDNPDNDYDTNLWYEPTTEHHGLIMYDFVDEFYGTWSPQTEDPWEICPKMIEKQIKIDEATVSGNNYTFNYYTEGFKTTDRVIAMEIKKLEGSSYISIDSDYDPIVSEWNNSGDFTFTITESGSYKMVANVLNVSDPNNLLVYLYVGEFELEFDVP